MKVKRKRDGKWVQEDDYKVPHVTVNLPGGENAQLCTKAVLKLFKMHGKTWKKHLRDIREAKLPGVADAFTDLTVVSQPHGNTVRLDVRQLFSKCTLIVILKR